MSVVVPYLGVLMAHDLRGGPRPGVDALRPAQGWLAPYSSVRNLLSGEMSAALGWLILDEQLTARMLIGAAVTLASVAAVIGTTDQRH